MSAEDAHRDAFWVLTVVGGMSVVKAIEELTSGFSLEHWSSSNLILMLRMGVFLVIAVRLFIGANIFFQEVHLADGHEQTFPNRNYVIDFTCAIGHFTVLYWLALAIPTDAPDVPVLIHEQFFDALCLLLAYDWAWFAVSASYSTTKIIRAWSIANSWTLALCIATFWFFHIGVIDRSWFEIIEAVFVFLFSIPDLVRMKKGVLS